MKVTNPAILLFIRPEPAESRTKVLVSRRSVNEALFNQLNAHVISEAQKTGYPVIIVTDQHGRTFRDRFLNAVKKGFSSGYDGLMVVGNDTPGQTADHFVTAIRQLKETGVVLGKSADGGAWLIGLHRSQFTRLEQSSIRWQTAQLYNDLVSAFNLSLSGGNHLPVLGDLDSKRDLQKFLSKGFHGPIRWVINHLISGVSFLQNAVRLVPATFSPLANRHRGPPAFLTA